MRARIQIEADERERGVRERTMKIIKNDECVKKNIFSIGRGHANRDSLIFTSNSKLFSGKMHEFL